MSTFWNFHVRLSAMASRMQSRYKRKKNERLRLFTFDYFRQSDLFYSLNVALYYNTTVKCILKYIRQPTRVVQIKHADTN
jgi:hypothetical protein